MERGGNKLLKVDPFKSDTFRNEFTTYEQKRLILALVDPKGRLRFKVNKFRYPLANKALGELGLTGHNARFNKYGTAVTISIKTNPIRVPILEQAEKIVNNLLRNNEEVVNSS